MKTKIFALLMTLVLVVGCFSVTASAAEGGQQTSGATNVCYTLRGKYSISIPGSLMMSSTDRIQISADYVHLLSNESVIVSVSDSSFLYDDERFAIQGNSNNIFCDLIVGIAGTSEDETFNIYKSNAAEVPVITYTANNADDVAEIRVVPNVERDSAAGAYTGLLRFDIALQVASENAED